MFKVGNCNREKIYRVPHLEKSKFTSLCINDTKFKYSSISILLFMREKTNDFTFSSKDREIINLMVSLGMPKNMSKMTVFLARVGEASSRDIENSIDMKQSEVSIATKRLRENDWVKSRSIRKPSKGRPTQMYKLRYSMRRILKDIEAAKLAEMEATKKQISQLKRLAK